MADNGFEHGWFTTTDDVKLHFVRKGEHGSWVVLIHGYTGSAEGNWCANGVADALAQTHRVVALDTRNHGRSDKPTPGGPGRAKDVIDLMNHLGIERAHIHGYSMGGMITARLLSLIPERFITASFGGSGVMETDDEWIQRVAPDPEGTDPEETEASRNLRISAAMNNGMTREQAEEAASKPRTPRWPQAQGAEGEAPRRTAIDLDLRKIEVPVLAINGEFDRPFSKTHRLWRELRDFTNVVLPGKSHLTAIVAGHMPPEYPKALVRFIDSNDVGEAVGS
ncbi:MAG TPA: alpha/beta hydrolase [Acidimicrobiales bacterium]|jgi:pimeloyl-ACP methyl ester carboxylesterase|nr:alpha/beta hydrolase [Acidimicrobiales bacterium]